jgi:hypothetical protein
MEVIIELLERLEQAIQPLSTTTQGQGSDHAHLYELLHSLQHEEQHEPIQDVRLAMLQELLKEPLSGIESQIALTPGSVAMQAKAAIGALVMLFCHLDEHDYEAAASALSTASQIIEEAHLLLKALRGTMAYA